MKIVENCVIIDFSELLVKHSNSQLISSNTANTWQADRTDEEKQRDTDLGKLAESAVELYINRELPELRYISYDDIRDDGFKKHAPFDGLICIKDSRGENALKHARDAVNNDVAKYDSGKICPITRGKLRYNELFTVEIKSTRVNSKKLTRADFKSYDDVAQIARLVKSICTDDFLTYPRFTQVGDHTWDEYCEMVCRKYNAYFTENFKDFDSFSPAQRSALIKQLELEVMDELYIRVYIDEAREKVLILGYTTKAEFISPPTLKKMIHPGKSEHALYLSHPLSERKPLSLLAHELKGLTSRR